MKPSGGRPPSARAICARQLHAVDEILAGHLVIDPERDPPHRPIGLPLQLGVAAGDRRLEALAGLGIAPDDGAGLELALVDRHLHDDAGLRMDRQEGRIGLLALGAQGRQHDLHHRVVALEHRQKRLVEPARLVAFRCGQKFVLEAERVEEFPQARVVVMREALVLAERIGHLRQRHAEGAGNQVLVGDIVRNLAQAVHVVREGDQPGRDGVAGQHPESVPHHAGARHLAERPDMRQAGGAVAGLEQRLLLARAFQPLDKLARLLEGPGCGRLGGIDKGLIEVNWLRHRTGFVGNAAH